jgi:hypothetical protein
LASPSFPFLLTFTGPVMLSEKRLKCARSEVCPLEF